MPAKPKTLLYREGLAAAEQRIVDALPDIVDGLIARAKEGDIKAGVYLLDRVYGKAASAAAAPADDRAEPLTEEEYERTLQEREETKDLERDERQSRLEIRRLIAGLGAGAQA